jgi:serine/threonine-protein kinase
MSERSGPDGLIGQPVGNYRIVARLGQGGMGVVYLAEHDILGRQAAVKVLRPELSGGADLVKRFFQEARATAQLRHPAFVEVFDSGTLPDGRAYLVMEYLAGESLAAYLDRVPRLAWRQAVALGREIARAMDVAHRHGIIHRDLKPDNIFLCRLSSEGSQEPRRAVKILDFGIAKLTTPDGADAGSHTRTGLVLGTPLYMSPEQCRGRGGVDYRADVYALGCVLHDVLTGDPPFPLEGSGEVISAHLSLPPPRLSALGVDAPAALEDLLQAMLAKRPDDRPADMQAVVRALALIAPEDGDAASLKRLAVVSARPLGSAAAAPTVTAPPVPGASPGIAAGGTKVLGGADRGHAAPGEAARPLPPSRDASASTLTGAASEGVPATPRRSRSAPTPTRGRRAITAIAAAAAVGAVAGVAVQLRRRVPANPTETSAPPIRPRPALSAPVRPPPIVPPPAQRTETPSAAAAPAPTVVVRISSLPEGATVVDGATGAVLGQTPVAVKLARAPEPAQLLLRKSGYKVKKMAVDRNDDGVTSVTLERKPEAAPTDEDARRKL